MITGGTAMTMETSLDPDGCTVAVPCRLSSFQVRDAVVPHLFDGLLGLGAEQKCRPKDMLRKKCVSIYICVYIYIYIPPAIQNRNGNSPSINVLPFFPHLNREFPMFCFREVKPKLS